MRVVILLLVLLSSLWFRLASLSQIPPVLLQKELKIGLASQVLNDSKINETFSLFSHSFGFIDTHLIAPLSILFTTPFIKVFGLTPFGVRFPSVLAGTAMIILFYFVVRQAYTLIYKNTKPSKKRYLFPLVSTLFFAFSPWYIQVSRIDTGVNLGLFFFLLGLFISLKITKYKRLVFFWPLPFVVAIYSDYLFFIPSTAVVICILIIFFTRLKHSALRLTTSLLLSTFLLIPILPHVYTYQIQIDRVNSENFTFNIQKASNRIEKAGNTLQSKVLNDSSIEDAKLYLKNITNYLEPESIFIRWGYNTGYISQYAGLLNPLELIFLIAGSIFLFKNNRKILGLLIIFIASIVVPQSIQNSQPDAIRIVLILVPVVTIETYGFFYAWEGFPYRFRQAFLIGVIIVSAYFMGRFNYFFFTNPGITVPDYYTDYQKAFEFVDKKLEPQQKIIVTDATYGQDISLYWIFLTKRENLAKKYIDQNNTTTFDSYVFLNEPPKKYKLSTVYIQPLITVPKYFLAAFLSSAPDKNFQISVFLTPKE